MFERGVPRALTTSPGALPISDTSPKTGAKPRSILCSSPEVSHWGSGQAPGTGRDGKGSQEMGKQQEGEGNIFLFGSRTGRRGAGAASVTAGT